MPRCFVTGAGGFIGSHLVELLVREGWELRALLRYTSTGAPITMAPSSVPSAARLAVRWLLERGPSPHFSPVCCCARLLAGRRDAAWQALGNLGRGRRVRGLAPALREGVGYLEKRRAQRDSPRSRELGLPIGSGLVEGRIKKLVKARTNLGGMRWTREGAQAVLSLRAHHATAAERICCMHPALPYQIADFGVARYTQSRPAAVCRRESIAVLRTESRWPIRW